MTIENLGNTDVEIVGVEGKKIYTRFINPSAEFDDSIRRLLVKIADDDLRFINEARRLSRQIGDLFNKAIENHATTRDILFDVNYQRVPDSSPAQHVTGFVEFTDSVLPAIQEPVLQFDSRVVFCVAVDRNGYLPTHNQKFSHPQKPYDIDWNNKYARNRRIFNDSAGLTAARNLREFLVQNYLRDLGNGQTAFLKEIDVPIWVGYEHWGSLRLAYEP